MEKQPYLPDPDEEKSENKAVEVREANIKGMVQLGKKRSSSHHHYDFELCTNIGYYIVCLRTKELGRPVSKSTVCGMKKAYYLAQKERIDGEPVT